MYLLCYCFFVRYVRPAYGIPENSGIDNTDFPLTSWEWLHIIPLKTPAR